MIRVRVIPVLLLKNGGLWKGERFKNHKYVGDPINAVKIFNEKEVDELVFLDISATSDNRDPHYNVIRDIASEAFMPFSYGGGINNVKQIERLFNIGVEKVIINSSAYLKPDLIEEASKICGSQSIVVSIDVKKDYNNNYEVFINNGMKRTGHDPLEFAKKVEFKGAGEIILTAIDREGIGNGYDLKLIKTVSSAVEIPVVAQGGASKLQDFADAVRIGGASAVAAGSMFTFRGRHKAVLITYPPYSELKKLFEEGKRND